MTADEVNLDWWQGIQQNLHAAGYDDRIIFTVGTTLSNFIPYWGLNAILAVFYYYNFFPEKRINRGELPSKALMWECFSKLIVEHTIIFPIALYFLYPLFTFAGIHVHGPIPSYSIIFRDFLVSQLANDFLFYWVHRLLHHPSIYQHIHKQHHRFNISIGMAASYAHPVENLLANLIPTLAGCFIMGSHIVVMWTWIVYRLAETIDGHSGYLFDWSPFHYIPLNAGLDRHDFHHSKNMGCYGAPYWDNFFGTDRVYLEWKEKQKSE